MITTSSKIPKQYFYLTAVLVTVFLLGVVGVLRPMRRLAEKSLILPFRQKIYDWQRFFKKDSDGCQLKNEAEVTQLKARIASLEEENKEQKRLLSAPLPKNWQFLTAKVIGSEEETIILNAGQEEKLKEGMTVLSEKTYLGRVFSLSEKMAKVRLATFPEQKLVVSVFSEKENQPIAKGLLVGSGLGRMGVEQILLSERIQKGDLVLTNIEGGSLLVGVIDEVLVNKGEMFKTATVKRLFNPEELETVFVVRGKL